MGNLDSNELYHHGILGMRWGVRRYQNPDGTLTEAGKKRYQNWDGTPTKEGKKLYSIPHWEKGYIPPEKRAYDENGKLTPAGQDGKEVFDDLMRKYYPDEKSIRNEEARRQKYDEEYHKWYFNEDSSKTAILKKKLRELDADDKMNTIMDEAKEILKEKGSILVPEKGNYGDIANVMLRLHEDSFYDRTKFPEQKKASLDRAAKNDSWELNFLETVQNDPVLQKGGKELLKEYSKYLDNPRKYMHEFKSSEYAIKTNPMSAVEKAFKYSSKDPKDYGKILQEALDEAYKHDPDLYDRKIDDVMDVYLMELFDEHEKKVKHSDSSEDFLEHHGILGMKWGVRRYQNEDGSLTDAGKKRYNTERKVGFFEARRIKKKRAEAAKKRAETLAKKKAEEESAQKHEAEKQEAIRSGNATQIAKFQNELSNQELRDALDRLNSKQRLSDLVDKETPKKETKLDKAMKIAEKGAKYADIAEKGIKVYNTFAKVSNAFADDDSQLPIIGEKREKKEVKEAKDPKKEAAIRSGDPEQLKKWQGKLTPEEVKTAKLTVDYWNSINDKTVSNTKKEQESGKKAAHSVLEQIADNNNSQYDPNEHQNSLWRNNFNPIEDRRKERAAQDKRIEELIKKYSK